MSDDTAARRAPARPARRRDRLVADLATYALTADTAGARAAVGRLLSDGGEGQLVSKELAKRLAKAAADFDLHPLQELRSRDGLGTISDPVHISGPDGLLAVSRPSTPAPVVPPAVQDLLEALIEERGRSDLLIEHGLAPVSKVLLTGPPGVGKSLTAAWLAAELRLPLARIEPALVMSSMLGESARNLRKALEWARKEPCVLLIDEFDAFAKRRDDAGDIGELKRLVNMLLLELEAWPVSTLLVAATNHPQLLDPAMSRRFDVLIEMPLPDRAGRLRLIQGLVEKHEAKLPEGLESLLADLLEGWSGSDIERLLLGALRRSLVTDRPVADVLFDRVRPPTGKSRSETRVRALFCALAHDVGGYSNRDLARLLGLASSTVSELVRAGRNTA